MTVVYIDDSAVPLIEGGGGGCFSGETLITTTDGKSVLISSIEIGDKVTAFDENGNLVISEVTETFYHPTDKVYRVIHDKGYLDITENHWVLKSDGSYQELKDFKEGDFLVCDDGSLSKIISISFLKETEVYNFKVSHLHSYIANGVKVHNGGGGGKGGSGREDPNSLFSTDILFITLGLSEGPIYRINPNGPQDIEFNEGNIEDLIIDNNLNTEKFYVATNTGSITQQKLPLFGDYTFIPQRLQGATELKKGNKEGVPKASVEKQNTSPTALTAVKFYFILAGLQKQSDKGDIIGHTISVKVTVFDRLGTVVLATQERTITGKTNVSYSFDIFVAIPTDKVSDSGYKFTIEKTSDDSGSSKVQEGVTFQGWTEIIEEPIAYTRTATIGYALKAFSEHKGGLPAMTNMVKGLIVKVPTNYNQPILENGDIDWRQVEVSDSDRSTYGYYLQKSGPGAVKTDINPVIYDGLWDGQFVYSWTQNPAWIIYDMLTNQTYGLSIPEGNIDKYSFYENAVYNDGCDINNGKYYGVEAQADGTYRYKPRTTKTRIEEVLVGLNQGVNVKERRFILDTVVSDQKQVMDIINSLTLTFRSVLYYTGGKISLYQDRPDNMPVAVFNETNIIANTLNISGIGEEALLTGVDVSYNDMTNHYRREVYRIDDPKALTERNNIENVAKIDLDGVSRKSQAIRLAQYIIADAKYSRRKIGFKTGMEAAELPPGAIISVSQRASSVAWGYGGIVASNSASGNSYITLEHIGSPAIPASFFTSNTKPIALRIASGKSGLVDLYLISNSDYTMTSTSNVSSGADLIRVKAINKYIHPSKSFISFSGSWGDSHTPTRRDVWTIGELNNPTNIYSSLTDKLFKVINMKRDRDETVFLEGKEYISNVYVDSDSLINYSPLRFEDLFSPLRPPPAPDFTLRSVPKRDIDGSVYSDIEISAFTDRTGYSNEIVTEFYHAKPLSAFTLISNTTPATNRDIITVKVPDVSAIANGTSASIIGKNGFTTEIARTRLLVTATDVIDEDPVLRPNGNISFTVAGFGGLIDTNFGSSIHILEVNDTFDFNGLKGVDKITLPINQKDVGGTGAAAGYLGFIGSDTRLVDYTADIITFNKTTGVIKVVNDHSGNRTLESLIPNAPFYISLPQVLDHRYFANNTLYITGSHNELVFSNVATTSRMSGSVFKQPLGVTVKHKEFVDVFLNGVVFEAYTLETGLDGLSNSQVSINFNTLPTSINNIDVRVVANVYTAPAIERGDNIAWNSGNTYGISNTSYDIGSPTYNAYLTANSIFRITLSDNIKSNVGAGYAVNITPNPVGVVNNVNITTNTFTFEYPSDIYKGLLNLGNNAVYRINTPSPVYEPLSKSDGSTRLIRRAEKGLHSIRARNVNKYGRRSAFITKDVTVRDIPIKAVDNLTITESIYKDTTLGVAVRVVISFDHIEGQEVTDYEISYKIAGSTTGQLDSFNTVKLSAAGVDSDGKVRFKIDNIEKGLSSSPNEIVVRVTPLNRSIRGSTLVRSQPLVGKSAPPQNVINFAVGQTGDSLVLIWQYIQDSLTSQNVDLDLLEVTIKRVVGSISTDQNTLDEQWPRADNIATVDARTNRVVIDIDQYGQFTYLVKTRDTSGNESDTIVASIFTSVAQSFTNVFRAYSEDDPSGIYISGVTNNNNTETAYASFYSSNNFGFPSNTFNASITDNANGTSVGWSVISGSPSDLRALSNAIYQTSIRDLGSIYTGALQPEISGSQSLKSTWLDYSNRIGNDQVTESATSGSLRDINFSGSLGIGNILGFSNASAATVTYSQENKTLVSGTQGIGQPSNVYGIVALGNFAGDTANANVFSLIASVVNATAIVLGTSYFANGRATGSNGFANLAVAGTAYKLVNLTQWQDLPEAATFFGTSGLVTTNLEFRVTSSNPYLANGRVNNSAFTSQANSDGFTNFVSGARTFRYFQFKYKVNNFDPSQSELVLDKFRYKVTLQEKTYTETITVNDLTKYVDYSRMSFTQIPKITSTTVASSSNQLAQPQTVIIDRGLQGANISVYFSNGVSAHDIGSFPVVDFAVTGV